MSERVLYGYFRSSAAFRVRIALNLKGLEYRQVPINLRTGQQRNDAFRHLNPQGLIPVLQDGAVTLSQSLAICEYLDEAYPDTPRLLPGGALERARARAMALLVACDIHPLNNLRVLEYLGSQYGADSEAQADWYRHWIAEGFNALEAMLPDQGGFCLGGGGATLADICLVPQVFNAKRFAVPLDAYPNLVRINAALERLPSFFAAHPSQQPDYA